MPGPRRAVPRWAGSGPFFSRKETRWIVRTVRSTENGRLEIDALYDEVVHLQSHVQSLEEHLAARVEGLYGPLEELQDAVQALAEQGDRLPPALAEGPERGETDRPPGEFGPTPGSPARLGPPHPLLALLRQGRYRLVNQVIDALHAADPECDLDGAADLEEEGFAPPLPPEGATEASRLPPRLPRGRKPGKIPELAGKQGCLF